MRHRYFTLGLFALFFIISTAIFFFLPPKNEIFIYSFISTVSFAVFFLAFTFASLKYATLGFIGTFGFFTINYLVGFQILNTLLLISVIIGIAFLIKK